MATRATTRPANRATGRTPAEALLQRLVAAGGTVAVHRGELVVDGGTDPGLRGELALAAAEIMAALAPRRAPGADVAAADLLAGAGLEIVYAVTQAQAGHAVEQVLLDAAESGVVAVDTETAVDPAWQRPVPVALTRAGRPAVRQPKTGDAAAGLDPYRSRVRLLQLYAGGHQVHVLDIDRVGTGAVRSVVGRAPALALHNAVFDLRYLLRMGAEPACRIYDTMAASWLTLGERASLATAAARHWGLAVDKGAQCSDWARPALTADQVAYAALDAVLTYWLWREQRGVLQLGDENTQRIADGCLVAVARMELAGVGLDREAHGRLIAWWRHRLVRSRRAVLLATGGVPLATPAQVGAWLADTLPADLRAAWPRTGTGRLTTAAPTLRQHPGLRGVRQMLRVRSYEKLLSAFGPTLAGKVHPVTNRLHAGFLVAGAKSGRFSSRNPNLQQLPKKADARVRCIVVAPAGRALVVADYSQIELRVAAELSQDQAMLEVYRSGGDIHTSTAVGVTGNAKPSSRDRSLAKALNFGLIYGAGAATFRNYAHASYGVDLPLAEATAARQRFFCTYPRLAAWQAAVAEEARQQGYATTVGGRRWQWRWDAARWHGGDSYVDDDAEGDDDGLAEGWGRGHGEPPGYRYTYALNHPIQGTAAEIMQRAIALVDKHLRNHDAAMIATVHDELLVECSDDAATVRTVVRVLRSQMTRAFLEFFPYHPWRRLVVPNTGRSWSAAS